MLDSSGFNLQATIDHHGFSIYCGHYTAFVYCSGKTYIAKATKSLYMIKFMPEAHPPHIS